MRDILRSRHWNVLAVAGVMTLLNSLKPLHIDDPFLYSVAKQISERPFDPYGFEVFWLQWPQPVIEELAPPVLPYWWGGAIAILGDRPLLWKLSLFPFAWLLAAVVYRLADRFAPGLAGSLTWMLVLSPAFLTGFNLMLDVPAYALGLGGLAVFSKAAETSSMGRAILAGVLIGLAMQTKYIGLIFPLVIFVYAALFRGMRLWIAAAAVSAILFTGWELVCLQKYGTSMFWGQLTQSGIASEYSSRASMIMPMIMQTGGLLPGLILIGLTVLDLPRISLIFAAAGMITGYGVLSYIPCGEVLFTILGILVWLVLGVSGFQLLRPGREAADPKPLPAAHREDWFLWLWLLVELGGYFAIAPWPAARRVMGIAVPAVLLTFRLASRHLHVPLVRTDIRRIAALGVALGLVFYLVDLREARKAKNAAVTTAAELQAKFPETRIWFVGHWGFQFYAERAGMLPVVPDHSQLKQHELLVVPFGVPLQEILYWEPENYYPIMTVTIEPTLLDWLPSFTTVPSFYGGAMPLKFARRTTQKVDVFRVVRDQVPVTAWPSKRIAEWTRSVGPGSRQKAIPALLRGLSADSVERRQISAQALGEFVSAPTEVVLALKRALDDEDESVREAAADSLRRISAFEETEWP